MTFWIAKYLLLLYTQLVILKIPNQTVKMFINFGCYFNLMKTSRLPTFLGWVEDWFWFKTHTLLLGVANPRVSCFFYYDFSSAVSILKFQQFKELLVKGFMKLTYILWFIQQNMCLSSLKHPISVCFVQCRVYKVVTPSNDHSCRNTLACSMFVTGFPVKELCCSDCSFKAPLSPAAAAGKQCLCVLYSLLFTDIDS